MIDPFTENLQLRRTLSRAQAELAQLKADPTLTIEVSENYPLTKLYTLNWRGYQHMTMIPQEMEENADYIEHIKRDGVEACIRAFADDVLPYLQTTVVPHESSLTRQ